MRWRDLTDWLRERLDPMQHGIAEVLGAVSVVTLGFLLATVSLPAASPELFRELADLGIALLIGYIVESTWLARRGEGEWIGGLMGFAIAALVGIALSLLLAEHRAAGHDNLLDDLGLAWIAASYLFLSMILVTFPWLVWERSKDGNDD